MPTAKGAARAAAAMCVMLAGVVPLACAGAAGARTVGAWDQGRPCPNILVIGARGSGQERDAHRTFTHKSATLGLGAEVFGFYRALSHDAGSLTWGSCRTRIRPSQRSSF